MSYRSRQSLPVTAGPAAKDGDGAQNAEDAAIRNATNKCTRRDAGRGRPGRRIPIMEGLPLNLRLMTVRGYGGRHQCAAPQCANLSGTVCGMADEEWTDVVDIVL